MAFTSIITTWGIIAVLVTGAVYLVTRKKNHRFWLEASVVLVAIGLTLELSQLNLWWYVIAAGLLYLVWVVLRKM